MKLIDTTIRDGSYAINFKFACDDVKAISSKLEQLGFEYIEIGHGMGLNASSTKNGLSLHTDIEYMEAARFSLNEAKFGFFYIPGIARKEDLHLAKDNGVSFVRIGIDADQAENAIPHLIEAKKHGLEVMVNLMKSYIITPEEFSQHAMILEDNGCECVYLVDSAGYMLSSDIDNYYQAVREKTNVKLGFHGHNNLNLAVANSLHCLQLGFSMVDCSLQGLGRSSGNASTEALVMILTRMGYPLNIDIPRLLEYGYVLLRDLVDRDLVNPLDYACGHSGFHSSFMKDIYRCSFKEKVDPLRLIISYCEKHGKKDMNYHLLSETAKGLPKDHDKHPYRFKDFFKSELF